LLAARWLASPNYFNNNNNANGRSVYADGSLSNRDYVSDAYGVRPAVSLKPGTEYTGGDGSMANPYKVELGS